MPVLASFLFTLAAISLLLFAVQFFRDPERITPKEENIVVSPADGKVVLIQEVDNMRFKGKATMVSIFMSPLNVHVNRNPISGKVTSLNYVEGQFIAAFDNDAGARNERTEIELQNDHISVFFKQISGYVARRIVCDLKVGDDVCIGERFGMIKFGSRVDIFLPTSVELKVTLGDKTTAGETVIAKY